MVNYKLQYIEIQVTKLRVRHTKAIISTQNVLRALDLRAIFLKIASNSIHFDVNSLAIFKFKAAFTSPYCYFCFIPREDTVAFPQCIAHES